MQKLSTENGKHTNLIIFYTNGRTNPINRKRAGKH
jgi:hypothetical protein